MEEGRSTPSRRGFLGGAFAIGVGGLAGCTERLWSRAEDTGPQQVQVTIKTLPADDDAIAAKILSQLRSNCQEAGINAVHEPVAEAELYRDVLLEGDYDVVVFRHPGFGEVDALRGLLHSDFVTERGWQNPFHFSDVTVDELLEAQLQEDTRESALTELFEYLNETIPYTTVAFPHQVGGARTDVDAPVSPRRATEFLELVATEPVDGSRSEPLVVGVYGDGLTERLNPIVVDRNRIEGLLDLVYDPLVRQVPAEDGSDPNDPEYELWLADEISWETDGRQRARVRLREGLTWHDGERLDANDVEFTWRFLDDTSLGDVEGGVPAPRYRTRQTLVDSMDVIGPRTLEIDFSTTVRSAATSALTCPILPEHVWDPRSTVIAEHQTEALVDDNEDPVGSGMYVLTEVTEDEIELEPFDDHVLRTGSAARPAVLDGFPQYAGIRFQIYPNAASMIEGLVEGDVDVTAGAVPPSALETVIGEPGVEVVGNRTASFYVIGYNHHHPQLGNPRFRRIFSRLVDRQHVVSELLSGYADPPTAIESLVGIPPRVGDEAGESPIAEFPGSDGEIRSERVRAMFEEIGYRYENDSLLE
ncbi:ABC transporter substrate-binding protein [Natrarchaeobaculum aegyptiacum]|uniref:ABC transporter substrate-binding protein n=1 Tax=Natrarchaeobaculum aegyptiacum TaxID=745377 RepID=A0A2Z2HW92_9EURY|nr:ABC transporter substrate-binding protein [Natrarchaeobaculum aegyptiacum]ARS91599.1 ABC transporter substrate-binding protein [Natrarchaeobaculum aegyptiacum]